MKQELLIKKKELPEGWRWVKLGAVCEINPRRPKNMKRYDDKETTFLPMESVNEKNGGIRTGLVRSFLEIKKGYTYFEENDILFAKITPCMQNKKSTIATDLIDGIGFGTTEWHVLRSGNEVLPKWIFYFIRNDLFIREAMNNFTGSVGQQRVPTSFLEIYPIVIPPLPEQQKIVSKLDRQMTQIEMMKKEAEKQDNRSKEALYSFVEEIFQNKYDEIRLDELIDFVKSGISRKFEVTDVGVPVIRSTNIMFKESKINLNDIRYWYWDDPKGEDIKKYLLDQGDILLNFINSPAQIGKACIYESSFNDCIYTTNTFRIKFNQKKILHKFFIIFSLSRYYRRQIEQTTKRAVNQASFTQKDLREIKIPLPSIEIQNKIISRFDEIELKINELAKNVTKSKDAISQLPSSILNEVFGQYEIPEVV